MERVTLWVHQAELIYPVYQCFKQARIRNEYIHLLLSYQIPEAGQMRLDHRMNSFLEDESLSLIGGLHGVRIPASNIMIASGAALNGDTVASGLASWLASMLARELEDPSLSLIHQSLIEGNFLFISNAPAVQFDSLQAQLSQLDPTLKLCKAALLMQELTN